MSAAVAFAGEPSVLQVEAGATREISLAELTRVSVGDPAIADVEVTGEGTLRLIGQRKGETTLRVWTRSGTRTDYRIEVTGDGVGRPASKVSPVKPEGAATGASEAAPQVTATLQLAPGSTKVISVPGVTRMSVNDPDIADIRHLGEGQIRISAGKPGQATLLTWDKEGQKQRYEITVK